MPNYTLDLTIDPQDLQIIKAAGLNITIAKPVGSASPNVTWLVFDPFQANKIQWEEQFSIYASPQQILQNGAVISRLSETDFPATDAAYYSFTSSATFSGPFTGSGAPGVGSYQVNNDMPNTQYPALTFGLQQQATINGANINPSPLNAALVPAALSAVFTPLTTVYIWLQASFRSGTVITQISSKSTVVTFGGTVTQKSLKYNPATGTFVPVSASTASLNASSESLRSGARVVSFIEDLDVKLLKPEGIY